MALAPKTRTDTLRNAAESQNTGNLSQSVSVAATPLDGPMMVSHTHRFIEIDYRLFADYCKGQGSDISTELRRMIKREISELRLKR